MIHTHWSTSWYSTVRKRKHVPIVKTPFALPGSAYEFARFHIPYELNEQKYLVQIFSRNAKLSQTIIYRRIKGLWRRSMRVSRDIGSGNKNVILKEEIHPEISIQ
jgi:hypothetical protein